MRFYHKAIDNDGTPLKHFWYSDIGPIIHSISLPGSVHSENIITILPNKDTGIVKAWAINKYNLRTDAERKIKRGLTESHEWPRVIPSLNNIIFTQPLTFNTGQANYGRVYYKTLSGTILGTGFTTKQDPDLVDSDFPSVDMSKWNMVEPSYGYVFENGKCNGGSLPSGISYSAYTYHINTYQPWMSGATCHFKRTTVPYDYGTVWEHVNSLMAFIKSGQHVIITGVSFGITEGRQWKATENFNARYCSGTIISPNSGKSPLIWGGTSGSLCPRLNTKGLIYCVYAISLGGDAVYESSFATTREVYLSGVGGTITPSFVGHAPEDRRCGLAVVSCGVEARNWALNAPGWTINGLIFFSGTSGTRTIDFQAGTVNGEIVAKSGISMNGGIVNYNKEYLTQIKAHASNFFTFATDKRFWGD